MVLHFKELIRATRPALIIFLIVMAARSVIYDYMLVPSASMLPTLQEGDRILVSKFAFGIRLPWTLVALTHNNPLRGDIVTFESIETKETWVKRVIGLPGDHLTVTNGSLKINETACLYRSRVDGKPAPVLEERCAGMAPHEMVVDLGVPRSNAVVVPDGMLFVMGDNRGQSHDSRYFGFLPIENLTGRVEGIAFSLVPNMWFAFRKDRFFKRFPLNVHSGTTGEPF